MSKVTDLWQVQIGKESTRGTSVTPTAKLMGVSDFSIQPHEESVIHEELRGSLQPGFTASEVKRWAEGSITLNPVSYEDVLYLLDGLFSEASPSGTAAPYTYSYAAPTTAAASPRLSTYVYGDGTDDYGLWGAIVSELTVTGGSGGASEVTAKLLGMQADEDDVDALSDRTVNYVLGHHWSLYIDAAGGTAGSTAVANTAFSFELTITPNRANIHHLGSLGPTGWRDTRWMGTLRLMMELTTGTGANDAQTYLADMLDSAPVEKQIQLKADNSANETWTISFAGVTLDVPELFSDEDGVTTIDVEFTGKYNSQLTNWITMALEVPTASLA